MANNISLTASMRSNLLSLQNISRQVSSTQNKLATGNKVNSAIDNPSSYYTARSLNNRANDLDALLDSMGQAVSTIKAATTALETGATFLEQAAAVATSALETNTIPAKSYFEEKVGENGAVVTTAQELKDAIAAGKETICVYGKIDYFNEETIRLQDGQKLVGTEYFTGYTGKIKFSQIELHNSNVASIKSGIEMAENSLLSDIYLVKNDINKDYSIVETASSANIVINNIDIYTINNNDYRNAAYKGIKATADSYAKLTGTINIRQERTVEPEQPLACFFAVNADANSTIDIEAVLNISNDGYYSFALSCGPHNSSADNSRINIKANAELNAQMNYSNYFMNANNGSGAQISIETGCIVNSNKKISSAANVNIAEEADFNYLPNLDITDEMPFLSRASNNNSTKQYASILEQYDSIIKDSTYKGVNLLKSEKLNVRFNENGSADLNVVGKDMSSNALGLSTAEWSNQGDIAQSLQEIASALKSIRAFTAELGNNYSIITNRQEFTENLINILTEGADKLTLADMNEESANMLSLQTRQQLAINSLSLASQASQAVLKLF